MKKFFTAVLIILFCNTFSQEVNNNTAQKVALNFCKENSSVIMTKTDIKEVRTFFNEGIPALYIFNFVNDKGFILVSASMKSIPVLGFSFESSIDFDNISPALTNMINNYKKEIKYLNENNISANQKISADWQNYLSENYVKGNILKSSLTPFHKINWNQGCYYNANCPTDANSGSGYCGHVPTGCGATVMAEIMRYYNYPITGNGTHSYIPILYPLQPQSADFGATTYHWSKMPYSINSSNAEIAQIMSHAGIAVSMQYSANGSGAMHADVLDGWINHFKYSPSATWLKKVDYPVDSVWENLIKEDLDSLRPVFYYGTKSGGTIFDGHYFILDGYSNDNYFHINWGWGGSDNGYFYLNALNPSGSNFNQDQQFIKSLKPIGQYCVDKKYTATSGAFNDGSGTDNYFDLGDCSYTIQVLSSVGIHLHFTAFDVAEGDTLYVYNGLTTTSALLGKYSGNSLPDDIESTVGKMYLNFITNDNTTSQGWAVTYHSLYSSIEEEKNISFEVFPNPCNSNINIVFNDNISGIARISILDITGRELKSEVFETGLKENKKSIDIREFNSGMYFMKIENNGRFSTKKINVIN